VHCTSGSLHAVTGDCISLDDIDVPRPGTLTRPEKSEAEAEVRCYEVKAEVKRKL